MTDDELSAFMNWYRARCLRVDGFKDRHLFVDAETGGKLDENEVGYLFSRAMNVALPGGGWSMHALRHSAISAAHLAIEGQSKLAQTLFGWSKADLDRARAAICGDKAGQALKYQALARFAGHSHGGTTWARYLHLTNFIVAGLREQAKIALPPDTIAALMHSPKASSRSTNFATGTTFGQLSEQQAMSVAARLAPYRSKATTPTKPFSPKTQKEPAKQDDLKNLLGVFSIKEKTGHLDFVEDLIGVSLAQAQVWIARAEKIKLFQSRRGQSRIAPFKSIATLQTAASASSERVLIQDFSEKLQGDQIKSAEDLKVWRDLTIWASTQGDHELRFTDPDALSRFLSLSRQMLPQLSWSFNLRRRDDASHELKQYLWRRAIGLKEDMQVTLVETKGGLSQSKAGSMEVEAFALDAKKAKENVTSAVKTITVLAGILAGDDIIPEIDLSS